MIWEVAGVKVVGTGSFASITDNVREVGLK